MGARFGNIEFENDSDRWSPDYGGIDWSMVEERLIETGELEPYQPVGFDSGDGLITECHQENLTFRTSDVAPYMDLASQKDERDGIDYIWFREEDPERFESLMKNMGHAALCVHTRFPLPDTVAIYLDRRATGLDMRYLNPVEEEEPEEPSDD